MDKFKVKKLVFDSTLVLSTVLLGMSINYERAESILTSLAIGFAAMATPILASRVLCLYYMRRSSGIGQYIIQYSYLIIILAGLAFYVVAFLYPSDKASGIEFILLPVTQIMAIAFALLLSVLFKNGA